jgi:hypothetical protein
VRLSILAAGAAAILVFSACDQSQNNVTGPEGTPVLNEATGVQLNQAGKKANSQLSQTAEQVDAQMLAFMEGVNIRLESEGAEYRAVVAEWTGMDMAGRTELFRNRDSKRLDYHFVPRDPRRGGWSGPAGGIQDDITWAVDETDDAVPPGGGLSKVQTTAAIGRAMATWDAVQCSDIPLTQNPSYGSDVGVVAYVLSNGALGSPVVFADVQHAGWLDLDFAGDVLGVTFTFQFIDGSGNPTDIDRNGKIDVAFREIYYDPSWIWSIDGHVDVETIALHEMGHGLSQAHFGELFLTESNGKFHFATRALMNAGYTAVQQELLGSDVGGHCSIWASWPNN